MAVLFKVTDKPFFQDNPEAKAIGVFKSIGETPMKFICLVYGHKTPLKNLAVGERKIEALKECGFPPTPKGRPLKIVTDLMENRTNEVIDAIKRFNQLQYDEDRDTYEAYCEQIQDFKNFLRKPDKDEKELAKALQIMKILDELIDKKKVIAEKLNLNDEIEVLKEEEDAYDLSDFSEIELHFEKS